MVEQAEALLLNAQAVPSAEIPRPSLVRAR